MKKTQLLVLLSVAALGAQSLPSRPATVEDINRLSAYRQLVPSWILKMLPVTQVATNDTQDPITLVAQHFKVPTIVPGRTNLVDAVHIFPIDNSPLMPGQDMLVFPCQITAAIKQGAKVRRPCHFEEFTWQSVEITHGQIAVDKLLKDIDNSTNGMQPNSSIYGGWLTYPPTCKNELNPEPSCLAAISFNSTGEADVNMAGQCTDGINKWPLLADDEVWIIGCCSLAGSNSSAIVSGTWNIGSKAVGATGWMQSASQDRVSCGISEVPALCGNPPKSVNGFVKKWCDGTRTDKYELDWYSFNGDLCFTYYHN